MTSTEFNEKWGEYLEERFYGLAINDEKVVEFLDKIFEELTEIEGFKYYQIKLKLGMPRFYVSDVVSEERCQQIEEQINKIVNEP